MLAREEARLQALFRRLLVLSAAAVPVGCSTTSPPAPVDASVQTGEDANGSPVDSGSSVDATLSDASSTPDAALDDATPEGGGGDPYGFTDAACDPEYLDGSDDGSGCTFFMQLPCGLPPDSSTERCNLTVVECGQLCNQQPTLSRICGVSQCLVVDGSSVPSDVPLSLECATGLSKCGLGLGRRPERLIDAAPARSASAAGAWLADAARLEAASVHAFRRLSGELASLRAPRALVRAAERSARDEARHARVTTRFARRRGAIPARVTLGPHAGARSLEALAIENAVEGCVRECFAALVATYQASHATDPELAREMTRIARDETRHAALSREVARWLAPRLDAGGRARVSSAMRDAVATLRRDVDSVPPDVAAELGLPTGAEATSLVDAFAATLFPS